MELNLGKIQKLSTEQILDVILGEINKIYSSINYIGMDKKVFYELAQKEITKSKKEYWLRTFETVRGLSDVEFALHIFHNDELKAETLLKNKKEFLETRDAILNCYKNMYF